MGKDARFCTRMSGASRHAPVFTRHSNYITCMRTERPCGGNGSRARLLLIDAYCFADLPACLSAYLSVCLPSCHSRAFHCGLLMQCISYFIANMKKTEDNFLSSLTMFRMTISDVGDLVELTSCVMCSRVSYVCIVFVNNYVIIWN